MRMAICCILAVVLLAPAARAAQVVREAGKVEEVTLYRGQALVTRVVRFEAAAGAVQLVVTELPQAILGDSLFASAGKGVEVRAVRYRTRAVGEAPEAAIRKLDEQAANVEKKLRENALAMQVAQRTQRYLDNLESFVAPTAKVEMTKGVLNAETLDRVTGMMLERRQQLAKELFQVTEKERDLKKELSLLRRKRSEITRTSSKTTREAVVFLDKAGAGKTELRLTYLVGNTSWSPVYNLRAGGEMDKVDVEYSALAHQLSGEDWDGVTLTLSTASAQLVAEGPNLGPLLLSLGTSPSAAVDIRELERRMRVSYKGRAAAQKAQQKSAAHRTQVDTQWEMNRAATAEQALEYAAKPESVRSISRLLRQQASGLSVNYKLEGKVSLASRRDSQMVEIARLALPAKFYYVATPLLSEYVYRYAQVSNSSKTSLLEGRGNVYLDGDFVGAVNVPMVAQGQKVRIGFGTDPQLRAWREFASKKEEIHGGNKEVTYRYRLVLDNYTDNAVTVRLADRIPMETSAMRVTLTETKEPLSKDAEYLRVFRPQGILRWDIEIPPHAAAGTAKIVEYSFKLEFERRLHLQVKQPRDVDAKLKREFESLMFSF